MSFERYADYALDVPMYFVYRDGRYIDAAGASFRDFLAGRLAQLPGERPTLDDWSDHLTTLFPEVRMKRFLEMRGADGGRWRRICALPAFWTGLLYDQTSLDAAWDLVKDWTAEERQALRDAVPRTALAHAHPQHHGTGDRPAGACHLAGRPAAARAARRGGPGRSEVPGADRHHPARRAARPRTSCCRATRAPGGQHRASVHRVRVLAGSRAARSGCFARAYPRLPPATNRIKHCEACARGASCNHIQLMFIVPPVAVMSLARSACCDTPQISVGCRLGIRAARRAGRWRCCACRAERADIVPRPRAGKAYGACYKSTNNRQRCQAHLQRCLNGCIRSKRR